MSEPQYVEVPLFVGKESKDVADLAVKVVKHFFVDKKDIKELEALLGDAIQAAQGANLIDDELKDPAKAIDFGCYVGRGLYSAFKGQ